MFFEPELVFLQKALTKYHLQTLILSTTERIDEKVDIGLKNLLNQNGKDTSFGEAFPDVHANTIYKLNDALMCNYIFLLLPETAESTVLVIGPYIKADFTRHQIMENAEKVGLNPKELRQLEYYFSGIPLIPDENNILIIINTFAERIWGGSDYYTVVDVNRDYQTAFSPFELKESSGKTDENTAWNMQLMENRYSYENELMRAVSQGLTHKAESMLTSLSSLSFEKRSADPLRNVKNYCIIMNTLLRKAAENGGVHPIYIDSLSSSYAKRIEALPSIEQTSDFMLEIFRAYSNLVKNHSISKYSSAVQKTIVTVDADLTADLSLKAMADINNVSASYLSALFKRETGQTLTDFVNGRRIQMAKKLLKTTNLQIQTIAQHCGILDVHYFTKMFKKYEGKTPKEYRASLGI